MIKRMAAGVLYNENYIINDIGTLTLYAGDNGLLNEKIIEESDAELRKIFSMDKVGRSGREGGYIIKHDNPGIRLLIPRLIAKKELVIRKFQFNRSLLEEIEFKDDEREHYKKLRKKQKFGSQTCVIEYANIIMHLLGKELTKDNSSYCHFISTQYPGDETETIMGERREAALRCGKVEAARLLPVLDEIGCVYIFPNTTEEEIYEYYLITKNSDRSLMSILDPKIQKTILIKDESVFVI